MSEAHPTIEPIRIAHDGIWNYCSCKKTFIITCGNCNNTFSAKVNIEGDFGEVLCPCGYLNVFNLHNIKENQDRQAERREFEKMCLSP